MPLRSIHPFSFVALLLLRALSLPALSAPPSPSAPSLRAPIECLALGDLNGDGAPDAVALARGDGERLLLFMNEDGRLSRAAASLCAGLSSYASPAIRAALADVNGDGWADLLLAGASHEPVALFLNRGLLHGAWLGLAEAPFPR